MEWINFNVADPCRLLTIMQVGSLRVPFTAHHTHRHQAQASNKQWTVLGANLRIRKSLRKRPTNPTFQQDSRSPVCTAGTSRGSHFNSTMSFPCQALCSSSASVLQMPEVWAYSHGLQRKAKVC